MSTLRIFPIAALLTVTVTSVSNAALVAFDSASDSAYNDGWQSGDNG